MACALAFSVADGCARRHAAAVPSAGLPYGDFADLAPGGRLRIVLPLAGEGFQIVYYNVIGGSSEGEVVLRYASSESTRDGKTSPDSAPPRLPFRFPSGSSHVRLIYLIRRSDSDHDMAIVSSKHRDELNAFTVRFRAHPESCRPGGRVACSWVPAGVAVRPES